MRTTYLANTRRATLSTFLALSALSLGLSPSMVRAAGGPSAESSTRDDVQRGREQMNPSDPAHARPPQTQIHEGSPTQRHGGKADRTEKPNPQSLIAGDGEKPGGRKKDQPHKP